MLSKQMYFLRNPDEEDTIEKLFLSEAGDGSLPGGGEPLKYRDCFFYSCLISMGAMERRIPGMLSTENT